MGILYQKMGKYREAVEVYDKAIENDPQNAKAYYNKGTVYQNKLKDYAKAGEAHQVVNLSNESMRLVCVYIPALPKENIRKLRG